MNKKQLYSHIRASAILLLCGLLCGTIFSIITLVANFNSLAGAETVMPMVTIGSDHIVKLEVSSTQEQIERGLMYRTSLAEDCGMVFLYHPQQLVRFWMYHTLIPLDMCFVRDGQEIVKICHNVPPCHSTNPDECPRYPQEGAIEASEVIELKGGYCLRHKVKEGDPVAFSLPGQSP